MDLHHPLDATGIVVAGVSRIDCRNAAARIRDAVGRLNRIGRVEATQPIGTLSPILDTKRSTEKLRDDAGR
jgi:hypothetical protein